MLYRFHSNAGVNGGEVEACGRSNKQEKDKIFVIEQEAPFLVSAKILCRMSSEENM